MVVYKVHCIFDNTGHKHMFLFSMRIDIQWSLILLSSLNILSQLPQDIIHHETLDIWSTENCIFINSISHRSQ